MKLVTKLAAVAALATSALTQAAPITDVQDYSNNTATEFFVDVDANKYNSPYYRDQNSDWGWIHNAIAGTFSSIKLQVSAFDVDYYGVQSFSEWDRIEVFDGISWVSLGLLQGATDVWAFTDFDLTGYSWAQTQVNNGLKVRMNIDLQNEGWIVTLGKATLSLDGGNQQCVPTPGIPCTPSVSAPGVAGLFGLGALAMFLRRRVGA
ncbi:hypothetical protein [Rheinheimera texasensis]|uniref:hypothetical protein n=1 Tax=Rheinheimera texasensis TaxID=306205 RepID=UPI0004E28886|nr:hypothetical protein [Rheinheimera texasensis]